MSGHALGHESGHVLASESGHALARESEYPLVLLFASEYVLGNVKECVLGHVMASGKVHVLAAAVEVECIRRLKERLYIRERSQLMDTKVKSYRPGPHPQRQPQRTERLCTTHLGILTTITAENWTEVYVEISTTDNAAPLFTTVTARLTTTVNDTDHI